ncbi:MAG: hypothetical protein Q9195_005996 [Heterodermia aff. obscurata]
MGIVRAEPSNQRPLKKYRTAVGLNSQHARPRYNEVKINGNQEYRDLMKTLSLPSSCHYSPPYNSIWEEIIDKPRQLIRKARKAALLPASNTVRVLSDHLRDLHRAIVYNDEGYDNMGLRENAVLVSTPHLIALYEEDILDAIEFQPIVTDLAMTPIDGREGYNQPRESVAAMAGNGWGLCSNYTDRKACEQEESRMPLRRVYTIEYTNTSLHLRLQSISVPRLEYESYRDDSAYTSFSINCHASHSAPNKEDYLNEVFAVLSHLPRTTQDEGPITDVQILSDCTDSRTLGEVLKTILWELQDLEPRYSTVNLLFSAARGAFELAKRFDYQQKHGARPNSTRVASSLSVKLHEFLRKG